MPTSGSSLGSGLFSSVREATGLGGAGSCVDECGNAASIDIRRLSVLVRGAVAVRTAGLAADGIAEVSSSLFDPCREFVLDALVCLEDSFGI